MTLKQEDEHGHSGLAGDGKKIKARDLDWTGYSGSGGVSFFAFDLWCLSGGSADNMFRRIIFPGKEGDMQVNFTAVVLDGQTNTMTGKFTQKSNTTYYNGTDFEVPAGTVVEISVSSYQPGGIVQPYVYSGSYRQVFGVGGLNLSQGQTVSFIATTTLKFSVRYATSGTDRPIVGCMMKFY